MPNCPECANREIQKKRKTLEEESQAAFEEGKEFRMPTYREIEEDVDFPMKLDPSTKHFICKRCGLYATREQISAVSYTHLTLPTIYSV